jgi:DNA sulfur modification protein DndD
LLKILDKYIEDILPLGISNLFLFDGEQVKELAEREIPPPIVVDAINRLLGLELGDRLTVDLEVIGDCNKKQEFGDNFADNKDLAKLEEIETKFPEKQQEYQNN